MLSRMGSSNAKKKSQSVYLAFTMIQLFGVSNKVSVIEITSRTLIDTFVLYILIAYLSQFVSTL